MTNYNPPTENLTKFNPALFEDNFTTNEVDTKIKNLETNKMNSTSNLYIETGNKTSTELSGVITFAQPYATAPAVFAQVESSSSTLVQVIHIAQITTTTFLFRCMEADGSSIANVSTPFDYMIIGELA
tara:strand:+ start:1112 stop:1495 length:384 start_codon:yes stop_codon:yes gene_type:complete